MIPRPQDGESPYMAIFDVYIISSSHRIINSNPQFFLRKSEANLKSAAALRLTFPAVSAIL